MLNDDLKYDEPRKEYYFNDNDLAEHDSKLLDKVMQKWRTVIDDDGTMYKVVFLKDIEEMKAEVEQ